MNGGGGGVNTTEVKWAVGELEWSTLMIVLDRAVCFHCFDRLLFFMDYYRLRVIIRVISIANH